MIDSVLKGTGNSRFLKSAVPAGTSWADALAMLQAGTFPIDFNGINTEGFQQVGTPLNKANLLKDATAAQIGLPPSTTPDGMFQALGNTGELHVWRKAVKNAADVPAGYTLEAAQSNLHVPTDGQPIDFVFSASITVGDDGMVSQPSSDYKSVYATDTYVSFLQSLLAGKFFTTRSLYTHGIEGTWYCPSNLTVSVSDNDIILSQAQKVNAHGIIPAETTNTYPVSTNPNAYQEGEYGKAGYTLGDVKTGTFQIGQGATTIAANRAIIKYGASVSVTDTGTASIANERKLTVTSDSSQSAVDKLKGKFFRFSQLPFSSSAFSVGKIYLFPANTVFTKQSSGNWYASKYQTVTSHGKTEPEYTIEYLGKLGDKTRVQVVSYVGTGTYGENNPCSLMFDFPPKVVMFLVLRLTSGTYVNQTDSNSVLTKILVATLNDSKWTKCFGNQQYVSAKKSNDSKVIYWFSTESADTQWNYAGNTYYFLGIG